MTRESDPSIIFAPRPDVPAAEHEPTEKEKTIAALRDLQDFHRSLVAHFLTYEFLDPDEKNPKERKTYGMESGGGHLSLERISDEGSFVLEWVREPQEDGHQSKIYYQIFPSKEPKPRSVFRDGVLIRTKSDPEGRIRRTELRMDAGKDTARILAIQDEPVNILNEGKVVDEGLREDGLHVHSDEQRDWDGAWGDFMRRLSENDKFSAFLRRLERRFPMFPDTDDPDKAIAQEINTWIHDFQHGDLVVQDADRFLNEVRDYWMMAHGNKSLPKEIVLKAEQEKGKVRPDDIVYKHTEIQQFIATMIKQLENFRNALDHHLKPEVANPYRQKPRLSS